MAKTAPMVHIPRLSPTLPLERRMTLGVANILQSMHELLEAFLAERLSNVPRADKPVEYHEGCTPNA